jgi:hypothetical protein
VQVVATQPWSVWFRSNGRLFTVAPYQPVPTCRKRQPDNQFSLPEPAGLPLKAHSENYGSILEEK